MLKFSSPLTKEQEAAHSTAEMGDRLATIDMGRKEGELLSPFRAELGPHLTQCGLCRGLPRY